MKRYSVRVYTADGYSRSIIVNASSESEARQVARIEGSHNVSPVVRIESVRELH